MSIAAIISMLKICQIAFARMIYSSVDFEFEFWIAEVQELDGSSRQPPFGKKRNSLKSFFHIRIHR
jgi:hypothetical protein